MGFVLRLGARPSRLALIQAELIKSALEEVARELRVEIVPIKTSGDRLTRPALAEPGGTKRLFVKELEQALAVGRVDLNVHSMKDLPADLGAQFRLVAVPRREDPRDALVSRTATRGLEALPAGARLGTSSARRSFEALRKRADLNVMPLRGNVDTRLARLEAGDFDGIIVALAGLKRLGRTKLAGLSPLDEQTFVPAAGQGALALEGLSDRAVGDSRELEAIISGLNDGTAAAETEAERAFLAEIGATCASPVGVRARMAEGALAIHALLFSPDGAQAIEDAASVPAERARTDWAAVGRELGHRILNAGGRALLADD
jgi:hydroxymethylbilane synthase